MLKESTMREFRKFPVRGYPDDVIFSQRSESRITILRVLHASRSIDPEISPELPL
jgi:plasmid stabilization system protein ParE